MAFRTVYCTFFGTFYACWKGEGGNIIKVGTPEDIERMQEIIDKCNAYSDSKNVKGHGTQI